MSDDPSRVERILSQYLAEGKSEKVTLSNRLAQNTDAMQRIFHQLELHEQKDDARHIEIKAGLAGVNARVDRLERGAEDTGRHNIEELRAQLKKREDGSTWWARFGIQTVAAAIGFVFASAIGAVTALLLKGK